MAEQEILKNKITKKYEEIKERNPSFSLRALAAKIGMSPSMTSRILSGKRNISKKLAEKVMIQLGSTQDEVDAVLTLFKNSNIASTKLSVKNINPDIIRNWQNMAVASLLETHEAKSDVEWISKRLAISNDEASAALKMLAESENQEIAKALDSETVKESHKQHLNLALTAIENTSKELCDYSNVTLAINPDRIDEAKIIIDEFRRKMATLLETGNKKEVYNLSVQLFPLSKN